MKAVESWVNFLGGFWVFVVAVIGEWLELVWASTITFKNSLDEDEGTI